MREPDKKTENRAGVLICGAYGMGNAGDEAVLEAILAELRGIDPALPVTVMTRDPEGAVRRYGVDAVYTFDVPGFLRVMQKTKLYINGGGSLIQDVTSRRSLWFYLYTIRAAKRRGNRVMMYGCGIGPVNHTYNRALAGKIIDRYVDVVTLREPGSLTELLSFGVSRPEIAVASDPALNLSAAPEGETDLKLLSCGMDPGGRYMGFMLRDWAGFRDKIGAFAEAADYAYEAHGLTPVFIPVNYTEDALAADAVAERLRVPCHIIREPLGASVTAGVVSRMAAVLSMRLHGLIFAAGQGVPLIAVSYDPKVKSFMESLGRPSWLDLSEAEGRRLRDLIDGAVLRPDAGELREAVERLRRAEETNAACARRLLGEKEREYAGV